jgi:enoyl-CoA hydratase/carnithine racemase
MTAQLPSFEFFRLKVNNGVAIVTIDRPPVNAMSRQVYESLDKLIAYIEGAKDIRSVVLACAEDARAWIGGADLHEFLKLTAETRRDRHEYVEGVTDRFYNLSRPTVAAITKPAIGGGMVFASFSDIVVAADTAFFAMPEVDRGLTGGGGAYFNRLNLPVSFIREMVLTGRRFTAQEMDKAGFINHLLPQDQVLAKAIEIAELIATKSGTAVRAIKQSVNLIDQLGWDEGRAAAHAKSVALVEGPDYKEGISAFLERRKPSYNQ